jgi:signal transduction histidine kinase
MIATYNHEINNPLTIAFGFLWKLKKEYKVEYIGQVEEALNRMVQIVKKIENLTSTTRETEKYAKKENIFKMK